MRSKSRSNFEIAITPLIFELERRTKSQNVGNGLAYLSVWHNFRYNVRFKIAPEPRNGGHIENFEIFKIGSFWHKIWKEHHKILHKECFWCSWLHWWRHSVTSKCVPKCAYIHVWIKLSLFVHECFDITSQNFINRCILAEYRALLIF